MTDVLEHQRTATQFRVLVAVAERQPAVSQGDIAAAVGVTTQAVSEHVQELADCGYLRKDGRAQYRVTKEGVDWLLGEAAALRQFLEHVTGDVLETVREDAAIATDDITAGDTVSLSLIDGLLHAAAGDAGTATGTATTDAPAGADVGVTDFAGVIDMDPGSVTIIQIPAIANGGSRGVDPAAVADLCTDADLVLAAGVEAVVVLEQAEAPPQTVFAVADVATDAARRGLDVAVAATAGTTARLIDSVTDAGIEYELIDL